MNSRWSDSGVEGAGQGACLPLTKPLTTVSEQGPLEKVTGGKQSGSKTHREHVRAGTVNIHKSKVKSERTEKDIQSLREQGLLYNIRQKTK